MRQPVLTILILLLALSPAALATPLQQVYDEAGPGAGYDKVLTLDAGTVYTGGLDFTNLSVRIISSGAQVDLQGDRIIAGSGAILDICGVVLVNSDSAALKYENGADGWVDHCTFYGNYDGVSSWTGSVLKMTSNIFSNSAHWGVKTHEDAEPWLAYNDAWENVGGNYKEWCSG